MKYLKYFEKVNYGKVNPDDEYNIDVVTRDKYHRYDNCDGVTYELSINGDDRIVYIEEVENTPENLFYPEQIDRYVQYIEEGGILQSFPVISSKKATNLQDMMEYIDDSDEGFDIIYSICKNNPWDKDPRPENEKMWQVYMDSFWDFYSEPVDHGFDEDALATGEYPLKLVYTIEDLHEVYHSWEDDEPQKEDYNDEDEFDEAYSEWEDKDRAFDEDILRGLEDIIKYFEDEEEYTLSDFNHRFEALKKLGKERIYVEVM